MVSIRAASYEGSRPGMLLLESDVEEGGDGGGGGGSSSDGDDETGILTLAPVVPAVSPRI